MAVRRGVAEPGGHGGSASGGAGSVEHMYEALATGWADAVLAASLFHFRQYTIRQVKEELAALGVTVRR